MFANNFHKPLLQADAVEREMSAIESEYKMNFSDDGVRFNQVISEQTSDENHIYNRFQWGSKKSLLPRKKELDQLLKDLRNFFDSFYSPDRMKLVVSVKSKDNLKEVKQWVTDSFSIIKKKKLGL